MEYKDRHYYISAHRDLSNWLKGKLEQAGAFIQDKITSYTAFVIEPRYNVIKEDSSTCKNCQEISEQAAEYDVAYLPLEMVASDLLDETFNPTWVCNIPDVITNGRKSSQILIPKDAGYSAVRYEDLIQKAKELGFVPKQRYRRGISYVVVPKNLSKDNVEWMRHILKKANVDSLFLIREDIFLKVMNKIEKEEQQRPFTDTGVSKDTELRKALVEEMKTTLRKCNKKFPDEFVVIDTEYKRFPERPFENLITEIGIIHVKDGKIVNEFDSLVKSKDIDPRCQQSFKYKEDTTTPSHTIRELKKVVKGMIQDLPIVGHGVRKDIYLLGRAFSVAFKNDFVDTQDLAKRYIYNHSYKLEDLAEKFGFQSVKHRALGDCETTLQLYNKLQEIAQG